MTHPFLSLKRAPALTIRPWPFRTWLSALLLLPLLFGCVPPSHVRPTPLASPLVTELPAPPPKETLRPYQAPQQTFGSASTYSHYLQGRLLALQQRHTDAIDTLKLALIHDPSSAFLLFSIAEEYAKLRNPIRTIYWARQALRKDKTYAPAYHLLAKIYWQQNLTKKAILSWKKATQHAPRFFEPYLELHKAYKSLRYSVATQTALAKTMIANLPDAWQGYLFLARILEGQGDSTQALAFYQKALHRSPSLSQALLSLARLYERLQRLDDAIRTWLDLLDYQPDSFQARLHLAVLYLSQKTAEATSSAKYHMRLLFTEHEGLASYEKAWRIAVALQEKNLHTEALPWLQKTLKETETAALSPSDLQQRQLFHQHSLLSLGQSLLSLGKRKRARITFQKVSSAHTDLFLEASASTLESLVEDGKIPEAKTLLLKLSPPFFKQPKSYLRLSSAFSERAPLSEIEAEEQRIRKDLSAFLQRDDSEVILHLSFLSFKLRRFDQTHSLLRTLLKRSPRHHPALNFLGYLYAEQGRDLPKALGLVRSALLLDPGNASYLDSLGWIFFRLGKYDAAEAFLRDAASRSPREATILMHLATVLSHRGQIKPALRLFHEASRLRPDPPTQKQIEAQIKTLQQKLSSRPIRPSPAPATASTTAPPTPTSSSPSHALASPRQKPRF